MFFDNLNQSHTLFLYIFVHTVPDILREGLERRTLGSLKKKCLIFIRGQRTEQRTNVSSVMDTEGYKDIVVHVPLLQVLRDGVLANLGQQDHVVHATHLHILGLPMVSLLTALKGGEREEEALTQSALYTVHL